MQIFAEGGAAGCTSLGKQNACNGFSTENFPAAAAPIDLIWLNPGSLSHRTSRSSRLDLLSLDCSFDHGWLRSHSCVRLRSAESVRYLD